MADSPFHQDMHLLDALAVVRQRNAVPINEAGALKDRLTVLAQEQDPSASPEEIQEAVALYQAQQVASIPMSGAGVTLPVVVPPPPPASRWRYGVTQDVLAGKRRVVARVRARQPVWCLRPYLRLTVPLQPGHERPIQLDAGGLWFDHIRQDYVRLRFDDNSVEKWRVFENPYQRLTLHHVDDFLRRVAKAHTLHVEVLLYGRSRPRTAVFDVAHLITDEAAVPLSLRERWDGYMKRAPSGAR